MATSNAATTYLENKLLNHLFKNTAFTTPGNSLYVGLATAVGNFDDATGESSSGFAQITEANFTSYQRVNVQASAWDVTSASTHTQTATNNAVIDFLPSGGGGTDVTTHVFIADGNGPLHDDHLTTSGGNGTVRVLFIGALDASKSIATGDIFRINATNLTIGLK